MIRLSQHNTNTLDFLKLYGKKSLHREFFPFAFTYFGKFVSYKQLANNQCKAARLPRGDYWQIKPMLLNSVETKTRARVLITSVRSSPRKVMHSKDDLFILPKALKITIHTSDWIYFKLSRSFLDVFCPKALVAFITRLGEIWIGEIRAGELRPGFLKSHSDPFWCNMHPREKIIASL